MAAGFKTAEPLEYHRTFLKENCRPDGRGLFEFRTTILNIGSISTADGSALVKVGNTTVICGIKAELSNPTAERPAQGFIVPNVDLPPLCSSQFRPGPPGEQAQAASQFMADIIESSEVILMEDLCIERGKLCWVLYCDLLCLDYDGNLLDACVIALLAALKNSKPLKTQLSRKCVASQNVHFPTARIPEVSVNKETSSPEVDSKKKRGLKIQRCPIATSFTVFDNSIVIADPTLEEECLSTAQLTVVTDEDDQLCSLHKPGGTSLSGQKLQECINAATTRHEEIQKLMDKVFNSVKPPQ
ncbi:exosome complex component RRP43 isoform X1 [Synchiropus splendidus]|uniref:exosome complex component RRP43 isoform X1 n=1 Tax=Synchiropus splendidus TaxID=270530 RepID=UPI00237E1153|nr:exosome complex component RRP43 isoform X1 [Synchiropus splendidus]